MENEAILLKAEVYDLSKRVEGLNNLMVIIGRQLGLEDSEITGENIVNAIKKPAE